MLTAPPDTPRWNADFEGVDEALRTAWRVNFAALDFRVVTALTLSSMLGLSLFVLAVLPTNGSRTAKTDSVEFALITLLIVMFSPLSFNYAYVWLIYPMTVALNLVLEKPAGGRRSRTEIAWLAAVFLIPATAIFAPLDTQAYGNLFVPALLLVLGLGAKLRVLTSTGWTDEAETRSHPSRGRRTAAAMTSIQAQPLGLTRAMAGGSAERGEAHDSDSAGLAALDSPYNRIRPSPTDISP
jgi:hypothetical protein